VWDSRRLVVVVAAGGEPPKGKEKAASEMHAALSWILQEERSKGTACGFHAGPIDDAAATGGGRNEGARMCHPPPLSPSRTRRDNDVFRRCPLPLHPPLPIPKTPGDDDDLLVVVVVIPLLLLLLPSRLGGQLLPPHTCCWSLRQ